VRSSESAAATHSKVISLYRVPAWGNTGLSFGEQLAMLAGWLIPPEPVSLTWSLDLVSPALMSTYLPPPDKPPMNSSL
jgi:hypothetical protein